MRPAGARCWPMPGDLLPRDCLHVHDEIRDGRFARAEAPVDPPAHAHGAVAALRYTALSIPRTTMCVQGVPGYGPASAFSHAPWINEESSLPNSPNRIPTAIEMMVPPV